MTSLSCHNDFGVGVTNFLLYLIQLLCPFFIIIFNGDAVNAPTWEVLAPKNPVKPPEGSLWSDTERLLCFHWLSCSL